MPRSEHSTAQHSTVQHSTAQHSTAQHNTAQHSTAHPCMCKLTVAVTTSQKEKHKALSLKTYSEKRVNCV